MNLTVPQLTAAQTSHNYVIVSAGPGSGKTATIANRILHRIKSGANPAGFLVISYTNAAANELRRRIGDDFPGICSTLHSLMFGLIQQMGHQLGFPKHINLMDEETRDEFMESIIRDHGCKVKRADLRAALKRGPVDLGPNPTKCELVVSDFYRGLVRNGVVDFDSILVIGKELLLRLQANSFFHIADKSVTDLFVDEVQDCSALDWQIFDHLPIENKFFVGDSDQAIFGWRGGDVGEMVARSQDPRCLSLKLQDNFRCASTICTAAQTLIQHCKVRIPKNTFPCRFRADGEIVDGTVEVWGPFDDPGLEKKAILLDIEKSFTSPTAILLRTNVLVNDFTDFFRSAGVDLIEKSSVSLPDDWSRVMLFLDLLCNPENDYLAEKFMASEMGTLAAHKMASESAKEFQSINKRWLKITPPVSVEEALRRVDTLKGLSKSTAVMAAAAINKASNMIPSRDLSLVVMALHAEIKELLSCTSGTGLYVGTLHSAKGLEFDTVYMPAMEQQTTPGIRASVDLEEERRLIYVGITRARNRVVMSSCAKRLKPWIYGSNRPSDFISCSPSQFIGETYSKSISVDN